MGAILVTLMWGVRRGLFSNEAGQGSAPIAHAAAKTDEPVSEGAVALLEPFIDTIVICTMTGLVIVMTGAYEDRHPTTLSLAGGEISWVVHQPDGSVLQGQSAPPEMRIVDGQPVLPTATTARFAWHNVSVDEFFLDAQHTTPFTGILFPRQSRAVGDDGTEYNRLYGNAVRTGAPLTMTAFERGIGRAGAGFGHMIVILGVLLFSISTAIAWSYYGDRCANYLFGTAAILPYRMVFVLFNFIGAVVPLASIWALGDVFLGVVIFPNLIALLLLSGKVKELTESYFDRRPWVENAEVHRRVVAERRGR
jgi:alanine or glycine:cation symporter, AGCS family